MPKDAAPNGDAPAEYDLIDPVAVGPRRRVSEMQAKLHRWAVADPGRRFDDLFPARGPGCLNQPHGRNHGEPVAWRHARRVRRAAWGNGPAAMPAPRPRPTHPSRTHVCRCACLHTTGSDILRTWNLTDDHCTN